jgi:hypothetical protein
MEKAVAENGEWLFTFDIGPAKCGNAAKSLTSVFAAQSR